MQLVFAWDACKNSYFSILISFQACCLKYMSKQLDNMTQKHISSVSDDKNKLLK